MFTNIVRITQSIKPITNFNRYLHKTNNLFSVNKDKFLTDIYNLNTINRLMVYILLKSDELASEIKMFNDLYKSNNKDINLIRLNNINESLTHMKFIVDELKTHL